jgi:transcriptional regulator with XRE-family HTH domain
MILSLERIYPSPFAAYLASALTGLDPEQRKELDVKQDIIRQVCKSRGIDLYLPKEKTDPEIHKDISAEEVFFNDIKQVLNSDLLILMTDRPSFGAGMEFKTSLDALIPIIIVGPSNSTITRMVSGRPSVRSCIVKYANQDELREGLDDAISLLRQNITDRKESLKTEDVTVGTQISDLRRKAGFRQEELAASVGLSAEAQSIMETSPDYLTNPSLLALRKLAQTLGVTVAEIVDPNFVGIVADETLKIASETNILLRARQATEKALSEDQMAILLVALQDRLSNRKRNRK